MHLESNENLLPVLGGVVAQRVARRSCDQDIMGSTPGWDMAVKRLNILISL